MTKRALALDSQTPVKKSKLSSNDDDDIEECTMEQGLNSLERDIEEYAIVQKNKVNSIRKTNEVYKKMQKKIEDCVCEFVNNETLCGLMQDLIREREEELDAVNKLIHGQARELASERKKLDKVISIKNVQMKECESMKKQLEGRIQELESIEKKLEGRVKEEEFRYQVEEFELQKEKFESRVKEHKLKKGSEKQSTKEEGEMDDPESIGNEILVDLEATSDPSKVVLDIIQRPIVPQNEDNTFVMESSHVFLLEQLLRISPHIKPHVRGEAMKLAVELKGNMRKSSENSLEVLGFLLLLSIYGLVPFFDEDEVSKLFEFADKSSDFVQNLVKKQQHIEAVRFICAFKLADKNQPVDLLWKYTQNAKLISESSCKNTTSLEIQDKARDQEVATLTNVLLCISDNFLESEDLLNEIQDRIIELNRQKDRGVYSGTWAILQLCNNLRKRNVGLKYGGRMESSESKSAAPVSNGEDPQQQQQLVLEHFSLAHCHSSDLSHAVEEDALGRELQNKLDSNGADEWDAETGEKVLDFNDEEPRKGEWCDGYGNVNEDAGREAYGVEQNEEKRRGRIPDYPLRSDAEDCAFYMKTGSCKFGSSCRFNHPMREKPGEVCRNYQRYGVCKFGKTCQHMHTRGKTSERSMNKPATETNVDTRRQKQMSVEEEFPERPGEPECRNFVKTGTCKFKSDCKFHHPRLPPCNLSDKGRPPRPNQNVCSHYSCKYEPACKYDRDRPHRRR